MPDWKQRVQDEYQELDAKIYNLQLYLCTVAFSDLTRHHRDLLESQCDAMQIYRKILRMRIQLGDM